MGDYTAGVLSGAPAGAVSALLLRLLLQQFKQLQEQRRPRLTDEDHAALEAEFQTHAEAMRRQVSDYADSLADGDPVLRERLRQVERGPLWPSE